MVPGTIYWEPNPVDLRIVSEGRASTIEFRREPSYTLFMTTKQKVIKAVKSLPANASYEDAMEKLMFLAKVEKGLQQADAGRTISHDRVKEKMKRWLK